MRSVGLATVGGVTRPTLNGEFVFHNGPLDQGYWPDGLYTAPTDEALRFDLERIKAFGFNMVRKHIKVEPQRWYYHADRLGLLVWQDMPNTPAYRPPPGAQERQQFELELNEMIDEHRSSPSIVMWVPFNEGWGQFDVARITRQVKQRDPSRLVNGNSGSYACCDAIDPGNGDIVDNHIYAGPLAPPPEAARASVVGEFGAIQTRSPGNEWTPTPAFSPAENVPDFATATLRYRDLYSLIRQQLRTPGLSGAVWSVWTDVEGEFDGILTYDRRVEKFDRAAVRAENLALLAAARDPAQIVPQPPAVPAGAVGLWTFEETTGSTVADSSGRGRTLTLSGGGAFGPGRFGDGFVGDGVSAQARTQAPVIDTTADYTVSAWVRFDVVAGNQTAVSQDGAALSAFYLQSNGDKWAFSVPGADAFFPPVYRANTVYSDARPDIRPNRWYHLTGVVHRANRSIQLYIDGEPAGSQYFDAAWSAGGPLVVGAARYGGVVDFLDGTIDQVRAYDRRLTPGEVNRLYGAGG